MKPIAGLESEPTNRRTVIKGSAALRHVIADDENPAVSITISSTYISVLFLAYLVDNHFSDGKNEINAPFSSNK